MNITELKALAEKATQGDMQATGNGVHKGIRCVLTTHMEQFEQRMDDAAYYAAANPAAILELIAQLEDAQGEIRALRATETGLRERVKELEEALSSLLTYADKNTCIHEETYRGGSIWTICRACDSKWADDEGGMPEWEDPKELAAARALLEKKE